MRGLPVASSIAGVFLTLQLTMAATVDQLYQESCAGCHGKALDGGSASALNDGQWRFVGASTSIESVIERGLPSQGMPGFAALGDDQIRALGVLIQESEYFKGKLAKTELAEPKLNTQLQGADETFRLHKVFSGEGELWGMTVVTEHEFFVTQQDGVLWHFRNGVAQKIQNTPRVRFFAQGGLLDVVIHPNYSTNGWIYLSFSDAGKGDTGLTKIVRGRIKNNQWREQQTIYEGSVQHYTGPGHHYGSRVVIRNGYVFFSIGDRGDRPSAQDLSLPSGKIHRLHDDGRIPKDNPFVNTQGVLPSIWSYGHRNPQGLFMDEQNILWQTEHGPRGGDELNRIQRGKNYGWPAHSMGINYDGSPLPRLVDQSADIILPLHHWTPSPGIAAIMQYQGKTFRHWYKKFIVTSLGKQELHLIALKNGKPVEQRIILENMGRIRDAKEAQNGDVLLLINPGKKGLPGALYRMTPSPVKGKSL